MVDIPRYPNTPDDFEDLQNKWSELVRLLENQSAVNSQKKILRTNVTYTDTDYNINEEGVLLVNASVSTRTVYLKNARNCKENIYWIKRTDSNVSNNVLVVPPSGETIDTTVETTIDSLGSKGIISDGENYWILS